MKEQKFFRGQRVRVADDLGEMMEHFQSGCDAHENIGKPIHKHMRKEYMER